MSRIKPYESQVKTAGNFDTVDYSPQAAGAGGRALVGLGQGLSSFGEAVNRRNEQNEISDATVVLSEGQTKFTNRLNEELQKGTVDSEKFMADYEDYMGKATEQFSSRGAQTFLKKSMASAKSHFAESTVAAQAELRAVKTKENYFTTRKQWTSALLGDPSSYKTINDQHAAYVETLVETGLDAKTAAQFRIEGETDIAKSAVRGWIDLNPEDAVKQLKSGQWDKNFDGDVKKQLISEAEMNIRANKADQDRAENEAIKALEKQQKTVQNDFILRMVEGKLTAKEIANSILEPTGGGSKAQFLSMLEQDNNRDNKIKTDSGVFSDVFTRIHLPEGDPDKITDEKMLNAYFGKGLTLPNISALRKEMQGIGTTAGKEESTLKKNLLTIAKSKLTKTDPLVGMKDPDGDEQYASFNQFFMEEYAAQKAAGKTPKQLLSPDSPDYIGRYIENYAKTPQEIMRSTINRQRKQAAPIDPAKKRKEGESIQDYLNRTKAAPTTAKAGE